MLVLGAEGQGGNPAAGHGLVDQGPQVFSDDWGDWWTAESSKVEVAHEPLICALLFGS